MTYNPWQPESDPYKIAVLGKLAEEGSEVATAATRCIIQGIDEKEPVTGKLNREWLEDEIADVLAQAQLTIAAFGLDNNRIYRRVRDKSELTNGWQQGLKAPPRCILEGQIVD